MSEFLGGDSRVVAFGGRSRINILAISGGGMRGLFSARVLARLEAEFAQRASVGFSLISGTSIGGIIACGLAAGIAAASIEKAIYDDGPKIFSGSNTIVAALRRMFAAKYSAVPLEVAIRSILGTAADRNLNEIDIPLVVPAVSHTSASPYLFRSRGLAGAQASDVRLIDVALATAAAPTYFPAHKVGNDTLVDGGLISNAPDNVALTEAIRNLQAPLDDIHMLSIGTAGSPEELPPGDAISPGITGWLGRHGLFDLTITAQERLATEQVQVLLGRRFLRIDARPSHRERKYLGIDRADKHARDTLISLADRSVTSTLAQRRADLRDFLVRT